MIFVSKVKHLAVGLTKRQLAIRKSVQSSFLRSDIRPLELKMAIAFGKHCAIFATKV